VKIRISGPSSPFWPEVLQRGVELLRARGHDVDDSTALRGSHAFLNGDDASRLHGLQDALCSDADVVWLARGGYGLTRIVDALVVPQRVPVVVGFSDSTALFARLACSTALDRCVHGPLATTIESEPAESVDRALAVIARRVGSSSTSPPALPPALPPLRVLAGPAGVVEGPLWAGNLVVLAALCGTPSLPSLAGHIVVIEEVGERPYRLDRVLTQLLQSGALRDVAAVVVGHLTGCDEPTPVVSPTKAPPRPHRDPVPRGIDIVVERLSGLGVPIVAGLPCGHEAPNLALPLGGRARLATSGATATLVADG
jgi:muramoyltetrapeptide carboxypeptidase